MDIEFNKEYKRLKQIIRNDNDKNVVTAARLEMAKRWLLTSDMGYITGVYNSLGIPDMYICKFKDIIKYTYICESYNTTKSDEYCRNINDVRDKLTLLATLPVIWYCAYNDQKSNVYLRELYSGMDKLLSDDIFNHAVKIIYSFYTVFIGSMTDLSKSIREYVSLDDHINSERIDSDKEFDIFKDKIETYVKSISDTNAINKIVQEEIATLSTLINVICDVSDIDEVYSESLKSKLKNLKTSMNILKERSK